MQGQAVQPGVTTTAAADWSVRRRPSTIDEHFDQDARRERRFAFGAVAAIVIVGGVVPVLIARHFGAFGIPRGDDVAYALSAFRLADTGTINGNHWPSMNLVGQLVLSVPVVWLFGHRIAALQVEVAMLGVIGLWAVFDLAKQLVSPRRALFVAVLVAVGPLWAGLSATYLTDVPAFALAMVCLALGARSVRRSGLKLGLFCASLAIGLAAFSIREYAIVAPVAVGLAAYWVARPARSPSRRGIAVALGGLIALAVLIFAWRRSLPGFDDLSPRLPNAASLESTARRFEESALFLGLLVSPAVVLAGPRRVLAAALARAPWATFVVCLGAGAVLTRDFLTPTTSADFLAPRSLITNQWTLRGTHPPLAPEWALKAVALAGLLSFLMLICAAVPPVCDAVARVRSRRIGRPTSPALVITALATIGYGVACVLASAVDLLFFTRYLLPLVPLLAILVLSADRVPARRTTSARIAAAATALLVVAGLGITYAMTSASFDGTKWSVAQAAARHARSPRQVDGGFEWNNYYAGTVEYPFTAHVDAACVILDTEPTRSIARRNILTARRVWTPLGSDLWIVARRRGPC